MQRELNLGPGSKDPRAPRSCRKEELFYGETGILLLSSPENKVYSQQLRSAFKAFKPNGGVDPDVLASVDACWKPNVTVIDLEWEHYRDDVLKELDVAWNPFELAIRLEDIGFKLKNASGLYDIVSTWHLGIASAIKKLRGR